MAGDQQPPAVSSQANGSADEKRPTNPYETNPKLISADDPFLARSAHYGRYAPSDDDFKPPHEYWCQSDPDVKSYWEGIVNDLCTSENSLNPPGAREAFAAGSVIIRVDREPTADAAAEMYSCLNANELSAARKAEDNLRELNVAVPMIYFCGTIENKNVTVESRIPGVSLEVAWKYLSADQIESVKQQCRRISQRLGAIDTAPDRPSYVCSGLNSQLPPDVQQTEKDTLFRDKKKGERLALVHNSLVPANIIVKDGQVVGITGWRRSGYFGFERAGEIHRRFRIPEIATASEEEGSLKVSEAWADVYEGLPSVVGESATATKHNTPIPQVKTEPLNVELNGVPLDNEPDHKSGLPQLDGAGLPDEQPTPKKIASLKNRGASRASSSDRSSPAISAKTSAAAKKPGTGVTKKGTARKPAAKKRKLNDVDNESVTSRRSNTPSSRTSKAPGKTKRGSASIAGSPAPEAKRKNSKNTVVEDVEEEEEEDEEDDSEDNDEVFCICRKPDNHTWMIGCDGGCEDWFHGKCVNIDPRDADLIDKYICPTCKEQGKGWTTWKPMCRLKECRKPARVNQEQPSKYCSDEHGREFMLQRTRLLLVTSGPGARKSAARTALGGLDSSANSPFPDSASSREGSGPDNSSAYENLEKRYPEDLGSRGGVLTTGDLKAVVMGVSSAEEFRKLGESIISIPAQEKGSAKGTKEDNSKKLGLDFDVDWLTYAPDEAAMIDKLRKQRDDLLHRREMLKARSHFVTLVRQRAKSILEKLKQKEPKGGWKDICGFDHRLAWSDEEFDEWRLSGPGAKALKDGTPEALALSYLDTADADGDTAMGDAKPAGDDLEVLSHGVCIKKRCERHKQWVKVQQQDGLFEESTLAQDLSKCEKEAQNVVERAVLRLWAEEDNAQISNH
ncbi:putative PHD transcription factor [Aspergillus homomorphus CBS 101889]|uniref:Putative PHD transcription factor n=1 Tax=Aspergillus homomorphus (strain CBS 101889) TaxID=1450537 RepID=A0A395I5T2_ASPHC|nr:putative PHD transcription factor [Aspergillus homomorphus CBS 101889]RAL15357.1 putative PHD transcription factor [Aspergillus homomorphus CBS 101889]